MTRFRTRVLLVAAVSALAAALVAAPASAHDALVDSTPDAGAALDAAPAEVVLTYSADVIDGSASIAVIDGAGDDWTAGDPVVAGTEVTVPLSAGMPDGAYEVRWRVASSDGHPIDGLIPFTVGDAPPATSEPTDAAESPQPDESPQPAETPLIAPAPGGTGDDGVLRTVLIGAGGALAAVAVFVVVLRARRRSSDES